MTLTITRAEILGPNLRLIGEATLDGDTAGIMLHHPALATPNQILIDGRTASAQTTASQPTTSAFDVTVAIDLLADGIKQLGFLRLRRTGGIEPIQAILHEVVFPGMQPDGLNHAHMINTLARLQRPRPSMASMLERFESLGDNCEFGVFTKAFGNRRPSLLGYGGTGEWMHNPRRSIDPLCDALRTAFHGLADEDDLSFQRHNGEWISRSARFDFVFHSGLFDGDLTPEELSVREGRRLQFVRRKFLQDLANPWKIFVRRSNGLESETDMRQLRGAMDRLGFAWLLWVDRPSMAEPAITITLMGEQMLRLTHPALRDYDRADDPDLDRWSEAAEAAYLVSELIGPGWMGNSLISRPHPARSLAS